MNFKAELIDEVFFVHWNAPPLKEDIAAVKEKIAQVSEQLGKKYIYVSVVAPSSTLPNAEQRKGINDLILECKKHCTDVHMVMKGAKTQQNPKRVIVRGLLTLTRLHDNFLRIHKSTDTVAAAITERSGKNGQEIIAKAQAAHVV